MANNKIYVKRTSTSGRTPNTTNSGNSQYIAAGELALNMADGILYSSNGSASIEIGANNTVARVTGNLTVNAIIANGSIGSANQVLTSNGSSTYWSTVSGGSGGTTTRVYQTYTAADGQTDFAVTGGYTVGYVDVFYNGVHLSNSEFTETGLVVSLVSAANAGAIVEVSGFLLAGSPGIGSNTEIYFNDSGVQNSNNLLTFDKTSTILTVGNSSVNTQIRQSNININGTSLVVGNTSTNVTINSSAIAFGTTGNITGTSYSGTANNATNAFGKTEINLNVNNALVANNATNLGGSAAAVYIKNTDSRVISGNLNFTATNTYFTGGLFANTLTLTSNTYIDLSLTANTTTYKEGRFFYESFDKSLNIMTDRSDFTYPVGQKEFIRVWNDSGVTILKGQPVYITGYHNLAHQHPTVALADASDPAKYNVVGLAGHDIANGTHGFVVSRGYIQYVNTANLTATSTFHLGFSAPGIIQTVAPQYPNYPTDLGICILSDAANGVLYVDIAQHTMEQLRIIEDVHIGGDLTVAGDLNITGNVVSTSAVNISTAENIIYLAGGDTITTTNFTGSGLNDADFGGVFTGTSTTTYYVKIDTTGTPDKFSWSKDNFASTIAANVSITGGFQTLDNGIKIKFEATTGHTLNATWSGTASPVNVDLGWAGNYNDGTYRHAGMFRDASDGYFKLFDSYTPEPNANVNIDTSNSTFAIADFWTKSIRIGNTSVYATINSSSYSGESNNALYLGGAAASAYVNTSGNYTFSGQITHSGNLIANTLTVNTSITVGPAVGFNFGTSAVFEGKGNANTFIEINMQNANTGNAASSDLVATADTGNDSVNFVDLGINGSTYNQAGFNIIGALDAYLYASNGHLAIGTASVKDVIIHAGGTTSADRIMTINTTAVTIANAEPLNVNTVNSIGTVNAVTISTGTNFVANSTRVTISGTPLSANGSNGTSGQVLTSNGSTGSPYWKSDQATLLFIIDGGSSAITTGQKGHLEIPFNCTINSWTLIADQSGSIVIDIWKDTYANAPPTDVDSITGSALPTLSSVQKNQSSTLTGWTTTLSAGDILAFNVDSVTTVTRVSLNLRVTKT